MKKNSVFTGTFWVVILCFWGQFSVAQSNILDFDWTSGPVVYSPSDTLKHAFSGGADLPQWSRVDLNLDGLNDLVAFDRQGGRWVTFINDAGSWKLAPEYAEMLPEIKHWGLFRDYNCDGQMDLFAYVLGGIGVWTNVSDTALKFNWALPGTYLTTNYGSSASNLYNYNTDIPAIVDIDYDGDLDILTFGQRSSVEWHEGLLQCGLDFQLNTACWGRFEESAATNDLIFDACNGIMKADALGKNSGAVHAGSSIMMTHLNGDSLYDALIGDVSFSNLVAAFNSGYSDSAYINTKDTTYPSIFPVSIDFFPAAFREDFDLDGDLDLMVSPNLEGSINTNNAWFYANSGTDMSPVWGNPIQDFVVSEMIDMGSAAKPALVDLDFDGDYELVVGSDGVYQGSSTYASSLYYFKNQGTSSKPKWELVDTDFADCGANNLGNGLSPTFGDIDGDMDQDMLVGLEDGRVILYTNTGNFLNPSFSYSGQFQGIDVGNYATPALGDLNGNGHTDLLIGNEGGDIAYYEHTGTGNTFTLVSAQWAGISTKTPSAPAGFSAPAFVYGADTTLLIGGMDFGVVQFDSLQSIMAGATAVDVTVGIGTAASTTIEETPFGGSKRNGRTQMIISADEFRASGGVFGTIGQIGFEIANNNSLYLTQGFTIKMGHVSDTAQSTFVSQGMTTVYNAIRVMTTGWNDINLTTPFVWNGTDHIVVEICFSKHAQTGDIHVLTSPTTFNSTHYGDVANWNAITNDGCAMPYGGKLKLRPNMRFNVVPSLRKMNTYFQACGERLHPAVADINADGYPDVIVGNQSGGLSFFEGKEYVSEIGLEEWTPADRECVLFPNPTAGRLQIDCGEVELDTVDIYDLQGRLVAQFRPEQAYDLHLPSGAYIVRLSLTGGTTDIQRLLVR
ncbi:MAG: hypothetical protein RL754_982 [Bacteroidota bacterium]|jgi:hypothetical protein